MKKLLAGALVAVMSTCTAAAQDFGGDSPSVDVQTVTSTTFTRQGQEIRVYSAKVVCGFPQEGRDFVLAPGLYFTAVNIHNPDPDNGVTFTKRVVEALPERALEQGTVGAVSDPRTESLGPNQAFEVDCQDAIALLGGGRELPEDPITFEAGRSGFLKGFIVIETRGRPNQSPPLHVVGVYTATPVGMRMPAP